MIKGVFIALGSNLGDREAYLEQAVEELRAVDSIALVKESSIIETDPVGGPPQDRFLNQVVEIETTLSPDTLLAEMQRVERTLGRIRREKWGPRTIDLDILLYGNKVVCRPGLQIPHPRMHERTFVLKPLCEIAPDVLHPTIGKRVCEILEEASRE